MLLIVSDSSGEAKDESDGSDDEICRASAFNRDRGPHLLSISYVSEAIAGAGFAGGNTGAGGGEDPASPVSVYLPLECDSTYADVIAILSTHRRSGSLP